MAGLDARLILVAYAKTLLHLQKRYCLLHACFVGNFKKKTSIQAAGGGKRATLSANDQFFALADLVTRLMQDERVNVH